MPRTNRNSVYLRRYLMSEDGNNSQSQEMLLADMETRRLETEILKNKAESEKLAIEAREIEKRLGQRWFSWKILIQSAVGGVVGSALLAAWLIGYFSPVLSAKQEIAKLENEKLKIQAEKQREENDRIQKQLQELRSTLEEQLESLKKQNEALQKAQAESEQRAKFLQAQLRDEYKRFRELAENQAISNEKMQYAQLADNTGKVVDALEKQISQFKSEKIKIAARSEQIAQQIQNLPKIRARVYIHIRKKQQRDKAREIGLKLEEAGFSVPGVERLVESGPKKNQLRFFRKAEADEAAGIVDFLASLGIETELVDLSTQYENSSAIRPRHYELWFSEFEF